MKCQICNKGEMILVRKQVVQGTEYSILRCNNCKHEVARRTEYEQEAHTL